MSGHLWTPEEDEWLRECYPWHSNRELEEFKALDGWPRSANSIGQRARKLGLCKAPGCEHIQPRKFWTEERVAWFREFVPGHTEREISAEHERMFGTPLTESQIGNAKSTFGVKSGTHGGQFVKGQEPQNKGRPWSEWMPEETREGCRRTQFRKGELNGVAKEQYHDLLYVRETEDGYLEIKVSPRNEKHAMQRWIPLGAFEWMKANGRDWPDGCRCVHADRDPKNCDSDNIVPVPANLWPLVNGANSSSLPWHDRETLEAAILSARITMRRSELRRERRRLEGREWACDAKREPRL